jgi:hypothetical protein
MLPAAGVGVADLAELPEDEDSFDDDAIGGDIAAIVILTIKC